jgi:hypothetical protein
VVLACGRHSAVDLRFNENVVGPADHDQMFNIIAANEHQLPLAVEAEGVNEAEPRLAGPPAWNTQPVGERQPVDNC